MTGEQNGKVTSPAGLTGLGSITVSGVAVWMLFNVQTSMGEMDRTLNQHGMELNLIRQSVMDSDKRYKSLVDRLEIIAVGNQRDLAQLNRDVEDLRRLATDPRARPDSWTRSDDDTRMREHTEYIKTWVMQRCDETRKLIKEGKL